MFIFYKKRSFGTSLNRRPFLVKSSSFFRLYNWIELLYFTSTMESLWRIQRESRPSLSHAEALPAITNNSVSRHNVNLPSCLANTEQDWIILLDILKIYFVLKKHRKLDHYAQNGALANRNVYRKRIFSTHKITLPPRPSRDTCISLIILCRYLCWITVYSAPLPRPILWWHDPI